MLTRLVLAIAMGIVLAAGCDDSLSVEINSDATVGCRAPTEEGCDSCCLRSDAYGPAGNGWIIEDADGTDRYLGTRNDANNLCPDGGLPACARCSLQNEQDLRTLAAHPVCDCDGVDIGDDACESSGCACFCRNLTTLLAACSE